MQEEKFDTYTRKIANLGFIITFVLAAAAILSFGNHSNPFQANSVSVFFKLLFAIKYQILDVVAAVTMMILSLHIQQVEQVRVNEINRPWDVKEPDNVRQYYESKRIENELNYRNNQKQK